MLESLGLHVDPRALLVLKETCTLAESEKIPSDELEGFTRVRKGVESTAVVAASALALITLGRLLEQEFSDSAKSFTYSIVPLLVVSYFEFTSHFGTLAPEPIIGGVEPQPLRKNQTIMRFHKSS